MTKNFSRKTAIVLAIAMVLTMALPLTAFAAEDLKIDGPEKGKVQLTITGVDKEDETVYVKDVKAYTATASAVVTLEEDSVSFSVTPLKQQDDKTWKAEDGKALAIDGIVTYAKTLEDKKVENTTVTAIEWDKLVKEDAKVADTFVSYNKGSKVTLKDTGAYHVTATVKKDSKATQAVVVIPEAKKEEAPTTPAAVDTTPAAVVVPVKADATPTASKVIVNEKETAFDAYLINNNNYFKLRDLAQAVNGSDKQFEVTYDEQKKAINLVSAKAYTAVGGELTKGDGAKKVATLTTAVIYKDGEVLKVTGYNINGNNYFMLRDVAKAFNIGVTYDETTKNVGIDTTKEYTEAQK